jgi:GNAT superfamily N-acetyltransferase
LLRRYEIDMRRDAWVPGLPTHQLPEVTRYYDAKMREVLIMWHRFGADETEHVVARELAFFANAADINWKIYEGDAPSSLAAALEAQGLHGDEGHSLMVCDAETMAALPLPVDADLRMLRTKEDVDLLETVWDSVWPEGSGGWVEVMREALVERPDLLKMLVACVDGEPATTAYVVLDPRGMFAYLGGGSTVAAYRGRGLYRNLVQQRARLAHQAGIRYLVVEAGAESRRILEKLGFWCATELRFFERARAK